MFPPAPLLLPEEGKALLASPVPLRAILARWFGEQPSFCLLQQRLRPTHGGFYLSRRSCYLVRGQAVSFHRALLLGPLLGEKALVCLAAGACLGEVMEELGWQRQDLRLAWQARQEASPWGGGEGFWLRTFALVGEAGLLGRVWEVLPPFAGLLGEVA
jgi:hypothetical protein